MMVGKTAVSCFDADDVIYILKCVLFAQQRKKQGRKKCEIKFIRRQVWILRRLDGSQHGRCGWIVKKLQPLEPIQMR